MISGISRTSMGLLAFAVAALAQRPSEEDAQAAIEKTRQKALDYARSLPDFVCTEVIHRYVDTRLRGNFLPTDKLTIKLSFFEQKEDHKLMTIDDKPTDRLYESLAGATGVGEFGGTLNSIFDRSSQASFHWESWKSVRKHRVAVYSYVVEAAHSRYLIVTGVPNESQKAVVGFHGVLDIDSETGEVLHFTYEADRIPKPLKVDSAVTRVDYDFADVGGRDYLLPSHSETEMRSPSMSVRNQMEFREYRKFSTESTVTFGDGK